MISLLAVKLQIFEGEHPNQPRQMHSIQSLYDWWQVRINRWKNRALKRLAPFSDLDEQQAAIFTSCLIELVNRVRIVLYRGQYLFDNICFENGVRCFCYVLSRSQPEICVFVQVQSSMLYLLAVVIATFSRVIQNCFFPLWVRGLLLMPHVRVDYLRFEMILVYVYVIHIRYWYLLAIFTCRPPAEMPHTK